MAPGPVLGPALEDEGWSGLRTEYDANHVLEPIIMIKTRLVFVILLCGLVLASAASASPSPLAAPDRAQPALAPEANEIGSLDGALALDWYYEGDQDGEQVGYAVGTAGDVNGDGYADLIVGAPRDTATVYKEGVAYVFYGGNLGLGADPDWTVGGGQQGSRFGSAVGTAGDVNGDGFADVIVGAPEYKNGQTHAGAAFVFHGSPAGLSTTPDWSFVSDQNAAKLGASVGTAGKVDGDGYDDIIVGAPQYYDGEVNEGTVFVFHGSGSGLSTSPDWTVEAGQAAALFGSSVGAAGDVDGDGHDDVIVGAPYYDDGQQDEGAAFIYYGSASGLGSEPGWTARSDQEGALFGASVAAAGDVNADGYGDLVVGAPGYDHGELDEGAAFAFYGSDSGPRTTYSWRVEGGLAGSALGISVAAAGDVNNDGYGDLIVGAHRFEVDQDEEGAAFLYHGYGRGLHSWPSWAEEGDKSETRFGYAVGSAGDINRDGYDDLVVGAPDYRHFTDLLGRAFGFYGPFEPSPFTLVHVPLVARDSP
jgi:hypothetical protein